MAEVVQEIWHEDELIARVVYPDGVRPRDTGVVVQVHDEVTVICRIGPARDGDGARRHKLRVKR